MVGHGNPIFIFKENVNIGFTQTKQPIKIFKDTCFCGNHKIYKDVNIKQKNKKTHY